MKLFFFTLILFNVTYYNCGHYELNKYCGTSDSIKSCPFDATRFTFNIRLFKFLFGFLSVSLICIASNLGYFILSINDGDYHLGYRLQFSKGLGFGSLLGSALFHLLPHSLKLLDQENHHIYLWNLFTVFFGFYFFFVIERLFNIFTSINLGQKETRTCCSLENDATSKTHDKRLRQSNANIILYTDAFHNFIDGLALGAAISESIWTGFSIFVGIICEEIPHELGDFAILISSGMSSKKAALFNFFSASTCYGGLILGITIGNLTKSNTFIFAFGSGMFLYISIFNILVEMNSNLVEAIQINQIKALKIFAVQNFGIISGALILFCLAKYDEYFT